MALRNRAILDRSAVGDFTRHTAGRGPYNLADKRLEEELVGVGASTEEVEISYNAYDLLIKFRTGTLDSC